MSVLDSLYTVPLNSSQAIALSIFAAYFGLIALSVSFAFSSITDGIPVAKVFEGKSLFYLRIAAGALLCTWYFMFQYMTWSFKNYSRHTLESVTIASWLQHTALFEEAWSIVCSQAANWSLSSGICVWTVLFTYLVWTESPKRGIKYPWAYMLVGQLVAMSFATALFQAAMALRPRAKTISGGPLTLFGISLPLLGALATIWAVPHVVGTEHFMPNLLAMHAFLLVPLFVQPKAEPKPNDVSADQADGNLGLKSLAVGLTLMTSVIGYNYQSIPLPRPDLFQLFRRAVSSHPAQGSITLDLIWVILGTVIWPVFTSWTAYIPLVFVVTTLIGGWIHATGINWAFVASVLPITALATFGFGSLAIANLRTRNDTKRKAFLAKLGLQEEAVIPGTDKTPPSYAPRKTIVGFWHPYCNAGGGGERVLWTAIARLQRKEPETISLVYSGDYPASSKESILEKINDRFGIPLAPGTLHFIALPSRHVIDDTYWRHFTLLGQSLGSVYLTYQGLCGPDGLWGDIFIDTMGYAFTYPAVRLLAGSTIAIGSYTHYPTVSADMVRRVRSRTSGVETQFASSSSLKTQGKLAYYAVFTTIYATCLLFAEYIMTNSSWTQAHIASLLDKGRKSFLASVCLMDETTLEKHGLEKSVCEVLYPPCDTTALKGFSLSGRKREIVSLAQFRPEKEHWKQIEALAKLLEICPEYKSGEGAVKLIMIGGARHPADEARVEDLKALAVKLGVADNAEFVVNAPYSDVLQRLSRASIGLNTMQDEHFGINVVEFMAAGLIPVVHSSAGPLLDIVVPFKGQRTGFHAKTSEDFAEALKEALQLSESQAKKMRSAARSLALEKFSEKRFVEGWDKAWKALVGFSNVRRRAEALATGDSDPYKGFQRIG